MKNRLRIFLPALAFGPAALARSKAPSVRFETNMGDFIVVLNPDKAPVTVKNFLTYVSSGFYNDTVFHRVIRGFMVQGGGMTPDLEEKPARAPIRIESSNGLSNRRGTIAMARTADPNSATSQFFINVANNYFLDASRAADGYGYTVFGTVTHGMDVIDKIALQRTQTRYGYDDVPIRSIVIRRSVLLNN